MTRRKEEDPGSARGIREGLRRLIREEVNSSRETSDEELYEIIDRLIFERGEEEYLPLKERIELRTGLFNSFRKLDILQQLLDDGCACCHSIQLIGGEAGPQAHKVPVIWGSAQYLYASPAFGNSRVHESQENPKNHE